MAPAHCCSEGSESKEASGIEVKSTSSWSRCKASGQLNYRIVSSWMSVTLARWEAQLSDCTVLSAVVECDVLYNDLESGQIT